MKNLLILLFLATGLSTWSQVAINSDGASPDTPVFRTGTPKKVNCLPI